MDMPMHEKMEPPKSTSRICVSEEQAKEMKVGMKTSMDISGTIKSIQRNYDDKAKYEVELEDITVDEIEHDEMEKSDEDLAKMPKEKLKEKISKKDEY